MQLEMTTIKEESEMQAYFDRINKEPDDESGILNELKAEGDIEDDNESLIEVDEERSYFVDRSGNYYFRATKVSDEVPSDLPEETIDGEEDDSDNVVLRKKFKNAKGKDDTEVSYILVMSPQDKKDNAINITKKPKKFKFEGKEDFDASASTDSDALTQKKSVNSGTFHCTFCEYVSGKRFLLARHMKCHSDDRPFKCSVCERGFKTQSSLQNHVNTHTGNKPHACKFCSSMFTTSGELVRHVRYKHTHERPHKCNECDYASVELSKLKRHIRCHTGERPYQCPHCTYASPDTFKLKRHLRIHTGEKPYECDICQAKFTQSNSLKAHKLIHSVGEKPIFQCSLCPTTCGRKTDLRTHVQKLHTSDKPIECKRCHKSFPDRYTYKIHSKTHGGEKCFQCDLCPYASISQRHLDSHLLIHTDQKPFDCSFCELSFRQKPLLKRHINLYHNKSYTPPIPRAKTHICPNCQRAFSHKGNLMRHMATHDPESDINEKKIALKMGRKRRFATDESGQQINIYGDENDFIYQDDTEYENDVENEKNDEDPFENNEKSKENTPSFITENSKPIDLEKITIKEEGDHNLISIEGVDGENYVVLEVVDCEDEEIDDNNQNEEYYADNAKNEIEEFGMDDYILSGLPSDVLESLRSRNNSQNVVDSTIEDNNMQNCFGFTESIEDDYIDPSEDERHHKPSIELLNIKIN